MASSVAAANPPVEGTGMPSPPVLSGGCLCGEIRYEISFPEPVTQWPPDSHTCQCTQCRKFTGSLIPPLVQLHPSQLSWKKPAPDSLSPYAEFNSSPHCFRGFCRNCGSSLTWRDERVGEEIEIFLGSLDQKWVVGEEGDGGVGKDVGERVCKPTGGRLWWRNVVKGVTDLGDEERWWENRTGGKRVEE